jgi:hypothetical protein
MKIRPSTLVAATILGLVACEAEVDPVPQPEGDPIQQDQIPTGGVPGAARTDSIPDTATTP